MNFKKKQKILYTHYIYGEINPKNDHPDKGNYILEFLYKSQWEGFGTVYKCKVLSKGWYKEVFLTSEDFMIDSNFGRSRALLIRDLK